MGLNWYEQLPIVDTMLTETQRTADTAFAAYNQNMRQLQVQAEQDRTEEGAKRTQWAANMAETQRCAKAEDNIRRLNKKLLNLGIQEQIPLTSAIINKELDSGLSWSSQILSQAYTDIRETKKGEIMKAAEYDTKKNYDRLIAPNTKGNLKFADLPYFDQQKLIEETYWEYMKTYYPEYFGILHVDDPEPEPEAEREPLAIRPPEQVAGTIGAQQALTAKVEPISANERQIYITAMRSVTEKNADVMIQYFKDNPAVLRSSLIGEGRRTETEMLAQHVHGTMNDQQLKDYFSVEAKTVEAYAQEMAGDTERNMKWGTFTAGVGDLVANVGGVMRWLGNDGIGDKLTRYGQFMQVQAEPVPFEPDEFTWRSIFDPRFLGTYGLRMLPTLMVLAATSLVGFAAAGAGAGALATSAVTKGAMGVRTAGVVKTMLQGLGGAALSRPIESSLEAGAAYDEARRKGFSHEDADLMADRVFNDNMKLMGLDAAQMGVAFMPMGSLGTSAMGAVRRGLVKTAQIGGKMAFTGITEGGEEVYQELILKRAMGEPFDLNDPETQLVFSLGAIAGIGFGGGADILTRVTDRGVLGFTPEQKRMYDTRKAYHLTGMTDGAATMAALADVMEKYPEVATMLKTSAEEVAKEVEVEEARKIMMDGQPEPAPAQEVVPEGYEELANILHTRPWAVISAEKDTKSKAGNDKALASLENILRRRKKTFYASQGREKDSEAVERGFFILDIDEITAAEIGGISGIDQTSVLVPRGILYTASGLDLAFDPLDSSKVHYGEGVDQYFTEVGMEGKTYRFSIPPKEGATQGHINRIGQQVTRAGFTRQLRKAFPELEGIKINKNKKVNDSRWYTEAGGTYSFIEIGTKDLAEFSSDPAEQETLFRYIALHEVGHEMAKEGNLRIGGKPSMSIKELADLAEKTSLRMEIAAWEWAVAKAREYFLITPSSGKLMETFLAGRHPELGQGRILEEIRSRGLVSALMPDDVKPQTEHITHGWENVRRETVQLDSGKYEARITGQNSKVILMKQELPAKPKVADFQALEKKLRGQREVKFDTKTGKFMKVKKTITRINKTNWDMLKDLPETRRQLALGAGFSVQQAEEMSKMKWAGLTDAQRSAIRASSYTMPSTQKGVAAWNKMTTQERENLANAIGKRGRIGALAYGAMSRNEQASLRLAILTEQVGITPEGKLEPRITQPVRQAIDPAQVVSLVDRLTKAIQQAKPIRAIERGLKHEELGQRASRMAQIWEQYEGKEAIQKGMSALKGVMPTAEAVFTAPEITPEEETLLYNAIIRSDIWTREQRFDQLRATTALTKVLSGQIPLESEFVLLEKQFGAAFVKAILGQRPFGTRAWETTANVLNLPRALLASWDLSAPLRQGTLLFWGQPRQSIPALKDMVKAFGSEKFTIMLEESINSGKFAQLMRDAGLYIAPYKGEAAPLVQHEEAFMTKFARYIPLVKHSERAYVTYLNKLRSDVFTYYANLWEGSEKATMENYKALAHAINVMSGRGDLPSFMRGSAAMWNAFFFSPRFISSRVMMPVELIRTSPAVRGMMARNIVSFVAANMLMFSLFWLATKDTPDEMTLEVDPRSTDFGKIKVGNTRIDFWGGFQPYARFVVQLMAGQRKYTTTGELNDLERLDLIGRFFRSKLSPAAGLVTDLLAGETFLGDEFALTEESMKNQAFQRLVPMFVQDMVDAMNEHGMTGIPMALPALLGANMQTYGGYTVTQADLDMLAQQYYRRDWNGLSADEQKYLTDWLGGLK